MKNEKGNIPVSVPESLKLSVTLGLMEPRILVRNEMAKNIRKIRIMRYNDRFMLQILTIKVNIF